MSTIFPKRRAACAVASPRAERRELDRCVQQSRPHTSEVRAHLLKVFRRHIDQRIRQARQCLLRCGESKLRPSQIRKLVQWHRLERIRHDLRARQSSDATSAFGAAAPPLYDKTERTSPAHIHAAPLASTDPSRRCPSQGGCSKSELGSSGATLEALLQPTRLMCSLAPGRGHSDCGSGCASQCSVRKAMAAWPLARSASCDQRCGRGLLQPTTISSWRAECDQLEGLHHKGKR